ncbi:hypothetical protein J3A83DRAFT_3490104 [Scleroderma citrinum]
MQVFLKTLAGEVVDVKISPRTTVADLKFKIQSHVRIPPLRQRHLLDGQELSESYYILSDYMIQQGSEARCVYRLRCLPMGDLSNLHGWNRLPLIIEYHGHPLLLDVKPPDFSLEGGRKYALAQILSFLDEAGPTNAYAERLYAISAIGKRWRACWVYQQGG